MRFGLRDYEEGSSKKLQAGDTILLLRTRLPLNHYAL